MNNPLEECLRDYVSDSQTRSNRPPTNRMSAINTPRQQRFRQPSNASLEFITRGIESSVPTPQNSEALGNNYLFTFAGSMIKGLVYTAKFSGATICFVINHFRGIAATGLVLGGLSFGVLGVRALCNLDLPDVVTNLPSNAFSYLAKTSKSLYEKISDSNELLFPNGVKSGIYAFTKSSFSNKEPDIFSNQEYINQKNELSSLVSKIDESISEMKRYTRLSVDYSVLISEAKDYFNDMESYRAMLDENNFDELNDDELSPIKDTNLKMDSCTASTKGHLRVIKVLYEKRVSELERKARHWFTRKSKKSKYNHEIEEKMEIISEINSLL